MTRRRRTARQPRSWWKTFGRLAIFAAVVVGVVAVAGSDEGDLPSTDFVLPEGRVKVEVLNTGGVSGMAREATRALRGIGFDVVDFGNAAAFDPERPSAVIDRVGRRDVAQAVADALGIDNVLSEPDPNLYVDVSVLVGSEWTTAGSKVRSSEPGN